MKAITIRQPWASLIAHGVKTIETRSRRTNYRGPIAIHAGQRLYTAADKHADPGLWFATDDALGGLERNNGVYDLPYGAIVATANLADCVPMIGNQEERPPESFIAEYEAEGDRDHQRGGLWLIGVNNITNGHPTRVEDQRPYGDFSAGRWAWLLDDIKPTTERCPWCWGAGRVDHPVPGVPRAVCQASTPCPVCWPRKPDGERAFWDDGSAGRCDPVPARGQQATPWEWTP